MDSLIINKLHRLKGEHVEEIIDSDGVILNDDQTKKQLEQLKLLIGEKEYEETTDTRRI